MRPTDEAILADVRELIDQLDPPRCALLQKAVAMNGLSFAATPNEYTAELMFSGGVVPRKDGRVRVLGPSVVEDYEASDSLIKSAYAMASFQSSCGTTTEACQRFTGVDDPLLYWWYGDRVNKAKYTVMQQRTFALEVGAWVDALPWVEGTTLPDPGDAGIVGREGDPNFVRGGIYGGEHEFMCVSWLDGYMNCIDGGQPGIAVRTRGVVEVWTGENAQGQRTGELWVAAVNPDGSVPIGADLRPLTGRRFIGFARLSQLPIVSDAPSCGGGGGLLPFKGGSAVNDAGDVLEAVGAGLVVATFGGALLLTGRAAWRAWQRRQAGRGR